MNSIFFQLYCPLRLPSRLKQPSEISPSKAMSSSTQTEQTFSHPPHPSTGIPLALTVEARDPHELPTFTSSTSPVLYLPPLLSSLPEQLEPVSLEDNAHPDHPPIRTETRLPDIDPASLSLHKALHKFKPKDAAYASTPYPEAFNWSSLSLPEDEERDWYCVVFRSRRKAGSDGGCTCSPHPSPSSC